MGRTGWWRDAPLARRLALGFAATAVAAALLTAVGVNVAFGNRFSAYLGTQEAARAQQVVSVLTASYQSAGGWQPPSLDSVAPGLVMSGAQVQVLGADGALIWSSFGAGADSTMMGMTAAMMQTGPLGLPMRVPITVNGAQVGTAVLQVPQALSPVADTQFRTSVNWLLLVAAVIAGAVALAVGLVVARRTTRPLAELTAAADELAAGNRSRRADVASADEIGQLARAFNGMADSVDREDELRQAFAADIAHELRTPLAILQGQLESIRDGITPPDPQLIDSLHEESLRMGRLVADLETMADAGAAGFTLQPSNVAVRPLIDAVLDGLGGHFAERHLHIVRRLEEVTVLADPMRLTQVVTNLLTNAATHTPPGGTITITVVGGAAAAELTVADTGSGISEHDLPRVFDRFFRGATSPGGGAGIGLAVAAELVAAHAGTITVQSRPGQGSSFRVRLPVPAPAACDVFTRTT